MVSVLFPGSCSLLWSLWIVWFSSSVLAIEKVRRLMAAKCDECGERTKRTFSEGAWSVRLNYSHMIRWTFALDCLNRVLWIAISRLQDVPDELCLFAVPYLNNANLHCLLNFRLRRWSIYRMARFCSLEAASKPYRLYSVELRIPLGLRKPFQLTRFANTVELLYQLISLIIIKPTLCHLRR